MFVSQDRDTDQPGVCDLGIANPYLSIAPCSHGSSDYGIRCVYDWWREQYPIYEDCHDINRDGYVDLANDILGAAAANGSSAGDPVYHPDADVDGNGQISLATDILAVSQQYQHTCAIYYYPQS
jgi:hypothetical protein